MVPRRSVSPFNRRGRSNRRGLTLEVTLVALVLLTVLLGFAATQLLITLRTANLDYRSTRAAYAAEGGTDAMLAQLQPRMADGVITDADLAAVAPPALPGFTFEQMNSQRVGAPLVRPITDGPFAGLYALNQRIDLDVTARDPLDNTTRIVLGVNAQSIPIFQFGMFYERSNPQWAADDIRRLGHTNGNLYQLRQHVLPKPHHDAQERLLAAEGLRRSKAGRVYQQRGRRARELQFDSRSVTPPPCGSKRADFDGRLMTSAYGVKPLRLPLPEGMDAVELIRPRNAGDNASFRE